MARQFRSRNYESAANIILDPNQRIWVILHLHLNLLASCPEASLGNYPERRTRNLASTSELQSVLISIAYKQGMFKRLISLCEDVKLGLLQNS